MERIDLVITVTYSDRCLLGSVDNPGQAENKLYPYKYVLSVIMILMGMQVLLKLIMILNLSVGRGKAVWVRWLGCGLINAGPSTTKRQYKSVILF